jgi:uncharacterized protein (TIGR03435 family)
MEELRDGRGIRRARLLSAVGLMIVAALVIFGLANATPSSAQSQTQAAAVAALDYEYEVVSIKPNKSGNLIPGGTPSDDGINVSNFPLQFLILGAFGVSNDRIIGLPSWVRSDRFDINAKMDTSVADALKKLSPDDRKLAQQHMLQTIFIERCKLAFHRETKELQTYTLVVGKNGPKFQESKPGETPAGGIKIPDGRGGTGSMQVGEKGLLTFHGLPLSFLVQLLSAQLGRTVVDKTGLNGKYDFTWQFTPDPSQLRVLQGAQEPAPSGGASGGGSASIVPADPEGTSLFTQIQEQLGLKLETGKGAVEIIVIDHIEKPSDN